MLTNRANKEIGPSIGHYLSRDIPGYFIDFRGVRFVFDRIARVDKDGGCQVDQMGDDEALLSPGLIYRLSPTPTTDRK